MNDKELKEVLDKHAEWLEDSSKGERANLYKANLYKANLYKANLSNANLIDANLGGANLYKANLYKADLRYANLGGANLRGANLSNANLGEANLSNADLYSADLGGSKNFPEEFMNLLDKNQKEQVGYMESQQSTVPEISEDAELIYLAEKESDASGYHLDKVLKTDKCIRYFYQNADVPRGDFYQVTKTDDGYEIYLKSPVDEKPKKIFIYFHEASVITTLIDILDPENKTNYKIFKEVAK